MDGADGAGDASSGAAEAMAEVVAMAMAGERSDCQGRSLGIWAATATRLGDVLVR